jgi:hypothetical protein
MGVIATTTGGMVVRSRTKVRVPLIAGDQLKVIIRGGVEWKY